jgi:hypothetical protein
MWGFGMGMQFRYCLAKGMFWGLSKCGSMAGDFWCARGGAAGDGMGLSDTELWPWGDISTLAYKEIWAFPMIADQWVVWFF